MYNKVSSKKRWKVKERFDALARESERIEIEHLRSLTLEEAIADLEALMRSPITSDFLKEEDYLKLKEKTSYPVSLKTLIKEVRGASK